MCLYSYKLQHMVKFPTQSRLSLFGRKNNRPAPKTNAKATPPKKPKITHYFKTPERPKVDHGNCRKCNKHIELVGAACICRAKLCINCVPDRTKNPKYENYCERRSAYHTVPRIGGCFESMFDVLEVQSRPKWTEVAPPKYLNDKVKCPACGYLCENIKEESKRVPMTEEQLEQELGWVFRESLMKEKKEQEEDDRIRTIVRDEISRFINKQTLID